MAALIEAPEIPEIRHIRLALNSKSRIAYCIRHSRQRVILLNASVSFAWVPVSRGSCRLWRAVPSGWIADRQLRTIETPHFLFAGHLRWRSARRFVQREIEAQ